MEEKTISVKLNDTEQKYLAAIIDAAVKAGGLKFVKASAVILARIEEAVIPKDEPQ